MSERVPTMRQIVQTNGPRDGPTLGGADCKTERATQVGFAEAVGAHKLPLPQALPMLVMSSVSQTAAWPLDIAQRDVLTVPAHTL